MLPVVKKFSQIEMDPAPFISHKPISAADMNSKLTVKGIGLPEGFIVTTEAFRIFLEENNLQPALTKILEELDTQKFSNIGKIGKAARQLILENELPRTLEIKIRNAHYKLCGEDTYVSVAIRSSATTHDLPACGFTQQLESFVNIEGEDAVVNTVHQCFASLFCERAIYDRYHKGIDNAHIAISIAVEKTKKVGCSSNQAFPIKALEDFDEIMSFKTVEKA